MKCSRVFLCVLAIISVGCGPIKDNNLINSPYPEIRPIQTSAGAANHPTAPGSLYSPSRFENPISDSKAFRVNDIVLICDDLTPRYMWPLGRVTDIVQGRDGHVRSVVVKTKTTTLKRPVHKLCLLEGAL